MRSKKTIAIIGLLFLASCYNTRQGTVKRYDTLVIGQSAGDTKERRPNVSQTDPEITSPGSAQAVTVPDADQKASAKSGYPSNKPFVNARTKKTAGSGLQNVTIPKYQIQGGKTAETKKEKKDLLFLLTGIAGILSGALLLKPFVLRMKKLSFFALQNRQLTRWIIGALHLALGFPAFLFGKYLFDAGVATSDASTYTLVGLTSVIAFFYPMRKKVKGIFKTSYTRQKLFACLMTLSGLALLVNLGNRTAEDHAFSPSSAYVLSFADSTPEYSASDSSSKKTAGSDGDAILTVLVALVFVLLLIVVLSLSCALACDGMTAAGALVGVGGTALLIGLLVLALREISREKAGARTSIAR